MKVAVQANAGGVMVWANGFLPSISEPGAMGQACGLWLICGYVVFKMLCEQALAVSWYGPMGAWFRFEG